MPLNSFECEKCGKRNNYIVELDSAGNQQVVCSMCGETNFVSRDQLPERVMESLQELAEARATFDDSTQVGILNDDESIVDTLLANMEETFRATKSNFVDDGIEVKMDMDIAGIAETYAPIKGLVDERSEKLVQDMMGKSGGGNWKREAASAVTGNVAEYVPRDKTIGKVLRYVTQSLENGMSIPAILDRRNMEAAGFSKAECFILEKLAETDKFQEIISQYFSE